MLDFYKVASPMDINTLAAVSLVSCVAVIICVIICYYNICSRYCLRRRRRRQPAEQHPRRRHGVLQTITCPLQANGHIENERRYMRRCPIEETNDQQADYYCHQPLSETKCDEPANNQRETQVCDDQENDATHTQPQPLKVKAEIADIYPPHIRVTADGEEGYAAAQSSLLTFSSVNKEEVEYFFLRPPPNETIPVENNGDVELSNPPSKCTVLDSPKLYCLVSKKSNFNTITDS